MATKFLIQAEIDPSGVVRGARRVRGELDKTEGVAKRLGSTLKGALGILALGAGIAAGTRVLAGFGQEMSTVAAITRSTGKEFSDLEAKARSLGAKTRFSATQAAEGMSFLARAGFDANEVLGSIEQTLELAQAGALGLGQAADIASNALTAFRLGTEETGRVVDVLAFSANNANTTVAQLADGLKLVAPIAAGVGVGIEETASAISQLSNAGLQATLAGTGLRRIISELESPSTKTRKILKGLNLEVDQYRVSSVGLTGALSALAEAGVDTGLSLEVFGDRGGPAFEVLRNSIPTLESFTASLENADGTAKRIAVTMDDNLNGAILRTKSALEEMVLTLGDAGATAALQAFFEAVTTGATFTAENIEVLATSFTVLGTAIAAVKFGPVIASASAAVSSFIKLRIAVATGASVMLGSATATQAIAAADVLAAKSSARRAAATLFATEAQLAETVASGQGVAVDTAAASIEQRLVGIRAANAAATNTLTAAQQRLAAANVQTTITARALALINPFSVALAGIVAAGFALNELLSQYDELQQKILETAEAGNKLELTEFGKVGDDILRVTKNIERVEASIEASGEASETAAGLLARYRSELAVLNVQQRLLSSGTADTVEEAEKHVVALETLSAAAGDVVNGIEQENLLLQENARERSIQAALIQEIAELERSSGLEVSASRKLEIESALRRNQVLADQASVYDSIRGPQEAFAAEVEALNVLHQNGRISTEEQTAALLAMARAAGGIDLTAFQGSGGGTLADDLEAQQTASRAAAAADRDRAAVLAELIDPLDAYNARLETIAALNAEGAISTEQAIQLSDELAEAVALLNPEYARQADLLEQINGPTEVLLERQADLNALIASGADVNGRIADELARVNEQLNPLSEAEQLRAEVLERANEASEDQSLGLAVLAALYETGAINLSRYNDELERLGVKTKKANTAAAGFTAGWKNAKAQITDVSGAAQTLTENGIQGMEDALVSLATTGKADFGALVDSILADLIRLAIRKAALEIFGGGEGGGGGGGGGSGWVGLVSGIVGSFFGGGKAGGGPVNAGTDYIVGEEGPELFSPDTNGSITPAGETAALLGAGAQSAAPVVNVSPAQVSIVNVTDPNEIPDTIESSDGEAAVMNVLRRNRQTLKSLNA